MARRTRRWNHWMIVGVVAFMVILYSPVWIKHYLIKPEQPEFPFLLAPQHALQALHFSDWSLEKNQGRWRSSESVAVAPKELASRWKSIVGTPIDQPTYQKLRTQLGSPQTIEVWYQDQEEPQRITYYITDSFWLLKNWQGEWIAVNVDKAYLYP